MNSDLPTKASRELFQGEGQESPGRGRTVSVALPLVPEPAVASTAPALERLLLLIARQVDPPPAETPEATPRRQRDRSLPPYPTSNRSRSFRSAS